MPRLSISKADRKANPIEMQATAESGAWFEKAPISILVTGLVSHRVLAANEAALETLEIDLAEVDSFTLRDLFSAQDYERIATGLRDLPPSDECLRIPSCTVESKAPSISVDLSVRRLGHRHAMIALTDASARVGLEQQLRQAAKMESVGMLAGGIAHDFNNLLTIISGYSQMLQSSQHMTTERDRTAIEQVLKASQRAAELTGQLLAFSRRHNIQSRVIEPAKLIDQTTLMLRRLIGEHIELQIQMEAGSGRIHADVSQIQQVVMNLVINSRDAMPDGGILMIETRNAELDASQAQRLGTRPGPYVMIAVSDTGTGIDPATIKHVFEPFFTTKGQGKGTGLGLSTVAGIVKQYGGAIDLTSERGHGTTFKVFFPRVEDVATEELTETAEPAGGDETVLLAEDEEGVRKMVTASLERQGYRVLVAASGKEALETSRQHNGPIHLLVTDMVMPQMNGQELAQRLTEDRPGTPVLFISGYPGETIAALKQVDSGTPFLQKPFTPASLTRRVRDLIDARHLERNSAGK